MMSSILSALEAALLLQTMVSDSVAIIIDPVLIFIHIIDSVEDGDKVVKTAIDNFGRVGKHLSLS